MKEKITTDTILVWLREQVEAKRRIPQEEWLNCAFKLNLLLDGEEHFMEGLRQEVARKKLEILKAQDKRNVALAEAEVRALDEYRFMREQEYKVDRVREFIRIAKKNVDQGF